MPAPVYLTPCPNYDPETVDRAVDRLLSGLAHAVTPGARVVVKPNLVTFSNAELCATHPQVVRAVCRTLLDMNAQVTVADSPAFGSAARVARASGLDKALEGLGIEVRSLGRPASIPLTRGGTIPISLDVLEADLVVNVPRFKAHRQMVLTGAVKNLFGCVCGLRKAVAHNRFGKDPSAFRSMIMDVALALPPTLTVLDAVVAMQGTGPVNGTPFPLGLLAACADPVSLDTALYGLLGLVPEQVPLWAEGVERGLPGADPTTLEYLLEPPSTFDASGFELPDCLMPIHFDPLRILKGRVSNLLKRLTKPL